MSYRVHERLATEVRVPKEMLRVSSYPVTQCNCNVVTDGDDRERYSYWACDSVKGMIKEDSPFLRQMRNTILLRPVLQ